MPASQLDPLPPRDVWMIHIGRPQHKPINKVVSPRTCAQSTSQSGRARRAATNHVHVRQRLVPFVQFAFLRDHVTIHLGVEVLVDALPVVVELDRQAEYVQEGEYDEELNRRRQRLAWDVEWVGNSGCNFWEVELRGYQL